jgi:hypothetical protein
MFVTSKTASITAKSAHLNSLSLKKFPTFWVPKKMRQNVMLHNLIVSLSLYYKELSLNRSVKKASWDSEKIVKIE